MTQRELRKRRHPGGRRRFTSVKPKGRQTQPEALEQVQALLAQRSRQRDLLIEHLHLIQDAYGALSADHLTALAEEMRLALSEVYETASFYAHFDIVTDETDRPPAADDSGVRQPYLRADGGGPIARRASRQSGGRGPGGTGSVYGALRHCPGSGGGASSYRPRNDQEPDRSGQVTGPSPGNS